MNKLHNNPIHTPIWDFVKKLLVASALLAAGAYAIAQDAEKVNFQLTQAEYDVLLEKAAAGDAVAQFSLGVGLYCEKTDDLPVNLVKRDIAGGTLSLNKLWELFEGAAKQGHAGAQYWMVLNANFPNDVQKRRQWEKKLDLRLSWAKKAGEQGHVGAQLSLGGIYQVKGERARETIRPAGFETMGELTAAIDEAGFPYYREAENWYRKVAEQGYLTALKALAKVYKFTVYRKKVKYHDGSYSSDNSPRFDRDEQDKREHVAAETEKKYNEYRHYYWYIYKDDRNWGSFKFDDLTTPACCEVTVTRAAERGNAVAQKYLAFSAWDFDHGTHPLGCLSLTWYRRWEASKEKADAAEQAEKQAAERAERQAAEQAEKQAAEQAEKQAAEQAEKQAAEQAEKQADDERVARLAAELAARLVAEQAEKQAAEQAARLAEEQAARQAAERDARLAAEQAAEQAARLAEEQAARQAAERDARLAEEQAAELASTQWFQWLHNAAEQGDAVRQHELGAMYEHGRGVAEDHGKAVEWYLRAAEQGNTDAQGQLGRMYENGRGVARNHIKAVEWYRKAAVRGNADAQHNLGMMYSNGRGVAEDHGRAAEWYRKAAEQGNADAQGKLGRMYEKGRGVKRDDGKAVEWYRRAAEQGNGYAQKELGRMYAKGRGVKRDDVTALMWHILSRDQMEPSSREDRLRKGLSDRKEAEAEQRAEACRARQYQDC